ncbi:putative phage tail protein [Clostridium sp. AM58-1XD]|uniref:putative phage tail protein n=1 Tax=Clostridium sp. AM58-1XD TaxID=2292307 RepID=UPI000E4EF06B|nr:putative phage tail protein [Clostridium sp. AM58-1XD]RGY95376.1 DUF2313 domain-containing protein [Clostridium sp. AM58-1XD]
MNLENFPTSESAVKLMDYVTPGWYDNAYMGKWIYQVLGLSLDEVTKLYEEFPEQLFSDTATWGLPYHERKYGLPVNSQLSDEERRRLIRKRQMTRIPMTPYNMEQMIKNITEFDVHVTDVHDQSEFVKKPDHSNEFQVVLIGEGTADLFSIRKYLDQVKQSHTVYEIFYYEHSELTAAAEYKNVVTIRCVFYPFNNILPLSLDGTWKLDGTNKLCGKRVGQDTSLLLDGSVYLNGNTDLSGYKSRGKSILQERITLRMNTKVGNSVSASVTTEKNQWKLEGNMKMDGSKKLNSQVWKEQL